ncbi:MAG: dihydrofolate reductase family protein [Minisyncoccia bacterium]
MTSRPITTLFLLVSADGKISTGDTDAMDFDRDLPKIKGVKEGLAQYYAIERTTDFFSLNSGRVMAKVGVNRKTWEGKPLPVSFIIIDNKPHLTKKGLEYFAKKSKRLFVVTTNKSHLALRAKYPNLHVLLYSKKIDLKDMMARMKRDYGAKRITIQTGGTLNAEFIRRGLVDRISFVIAPVLVGGKSTATAMDGESLRRTSELFKLKALKLRKVKKLKHSYLHLQYDVIN